MFVVVGAWSVASMFRFCVGQHDENRTFNFEPYRQTKPDERVSTSSSQAWIQQNKGYTAPARTNQPRHNAWTKPIANITAIRTAKTTPKTPQDERSINTNTTTTIATDQYDTLAANIQRLTEMVLKSQQSDAIRASRDAERDRRDANYAQAQREQHRQIQTLIARADSQDKEKATNMTMRRNLKLYQQNKASTTASHHDKIETVEANHNARLNSMQSDINTVKSAIVDIRNAQHDQYIQLEYKH